MDSGQFYSEYLCFGSPADVKLDIKESTYKKLGKFFEDMVKRKVIETKQLKEKKGQQGGTQIAKINWDNE